MWDWLKMPNVPYFTLRPQLSLSACSYLRQPDSTSALGVTGRLGSTAKSWREKEYHRIARTCSPLKPART